MRNQWDSVLEYIVADGTAVDDTTTEEVIFPASSFLIPANFMNHHRALAFELYGKLSTTGTPTITFGVRWGGVGGTIIGLSEALTNGSGVANVNWSLKGVIQSRSGGAAGTLLCFGEAKLHTAAGTVLTNVFSVSGYDAPAVVSIDHTAAADLAFTADWSAASASNTLTGMYGRVWSTN
jgi:hypothetical protein